MHLSDNEQERLLNSSERVSEEYLGSQAMASVVRDSQGRLYRILWTRGFPGEENTFESGELEQVFPVESVTIQRNPTLYLTDEEQLAVRPTFAHKLLDDVESYELATGSALAEPLTQKVYDLAGDLREALDGLGSMDLAAEAGAYREATKQYLDGLMALWEETKR